MKGVSKFLLKQFQVTQQTIRVPMGYIPGQMLHVVAGRGASTNTNGQLPEYATLPRPRTAANNGNYAYVGGSVTSSEKGTDNNVKFIERGAPEGAASVQQVDQKVTSVSQVQQQGQQQPINNQANVFYAMNV